MPWAYRSAAQPNERYHLFLTRCWSVASLRAQHARCCCLIAWSALSEMPVKIESIGGQIEANSWMSWAAARCNWRTLKAGCREEPVLMVAVWGKQGYRGGPHRSHFRLQADSGGVKGQSLIRVEGGHTWEPSRLACPIVKQHLTTPTNPPTSLYLHGVVQFNMPIHGILIIYNVYTIEFSSFNYSILNTCKLFNTKCIRLVIKQTILLDKNILQKRYD